MEEILVWKESKTHMSDTKMKTFRNTAPEEWSRLQPRTTISSKSMKTIILHRRQQAGFILTPLFEAILKFLRKSSSNIFQILFSCASQLSVTKQILGVPVKGR